MATKNKRRKPAKERITLAPTNWDMGARGQANRIGLVVEDRGETDPATGKTINPNGVKGARRVDMLDELRRAGILTIQQWNTAKWLRGLSCGNRANDPLSAVVVDRTPDRSDPAAAAFDAKRAFHRVMAKMPTECRRPIVALLDFLDDESSGVSIKMYEKIDIYARVRVGLDAITGARNER